MTSKAENQPTTHLGNKELHRRHSVMVEGGVVPRAKVMDQTMIDKLLMRGQITLAQHRAGEYLLNQAARAGIYPRGINWDSAGGTKPGPRVPFGMFPFGRTIIIVKRRYGWFHAYLVQEVVCQNWDVSADEMKMKCLREALDWIADRRMALRYDPLAHLRRAKKKGAERTAPQPTP